MVESVREVVEELDISEDKEVDISKLKKSLDKLKSLMHKPKHLTKSSKKIKKRRAKSKVGKQSRVKSHVCIMT